MLTILIIEDEVSIRKAYGTFLAQRGFNIIEAGDGLTALDLVHAADLVLLDIMLPYLDGWQVADQIRLDHPGKPILMLTALGTRDQQLKGFDLGVDDYLTKPVDLHELEARIRAVLRRGGLLVQQLVHGDLEISVNAHEVFLAGQRITLAPLEFTVLVMLARHPGRIWSRGDLISAAWGADYFGVERTVDVRVANIRRALGDDRSAPRFIETIRGIGYRFLAQS